MYKPEQQWITINTGQSNSGSSKSNDNEIEIDGKKSEDAEIAASIANKNDKAVSLIETFTSALDNAINTEHLETYRVNGNVGTLIAQKLLKGEKIRVCRNGEPVNIDNDITEEEEFTMLMPIKKR